jgi:hypothetical protein
MGDIRITRGRVETDDLPVKSNYMEKEARKDLSERQIKHDLMTIRMLFIKDLLGDLAIYNKNPKLKDIKKKGYECSYTRYNKEYYNELIDDLNSDFVINFCRIFSIPYKVFTEFAMTNTKKVYTELNEYLDFNNPDRKLLSQYLSCGGHKGHKVPKHIKWLLMK